MHKDKLTKTFSQLKDKVEADEIILGCSGPGFNKFIYAFLGSSYLLSMIAFGAIMSLSPLGTALVSAALIILSAVVLAIVAYSAYVDARFSADKQFNEIEAGIDFISKYSEGVLTDEEF